LRAGDGSQLASVEAGTVLPDVVSGHFEEPTGPPVSTVPLLPRRHRFASAPMVAEVAGAIQDRTGELLAQDVALMMGSVRVDAETDPERVRRTLTEARRGHPTRELVDQLAEPYLAS